MKRFIFGLVVIVGLTGLAACSSPTVAPAAPKAAVNTQAQPPAQVQAQPPATPAAAIQTFEILQSNNTFQPNQVTVKAGSQVRFTLRNSDGEDHNIVSLNALVKFPENKQAPGGTYTVDWVAPDKPGTYDALCVFHSPGMTLKITVQ